MKENNYLLEKDFDIDIIKLQGVINKRNLDIMIRNVMYKETLRSIAKDCKLTPERVRQIVCHSLRKCRDYLRKNNLLWA